MYLPRLRRLAGFSHQLVCPSLGFWISGAIPRTRSYNVEPPTKMVLASIICKNATAIRGHGESTETSLYGHRAVDA